MNRFIYTGITLAVIVIVLSGASQAVHASVNVGAPEQIAGADYIGPGTAYMLMYVVVGLLVGGATMLTMYRGRVKTFFAGVFNRRRNEKESDEVEDTEEGE